MNVSRVVTGVVRSLAVLGGVVLSVVTLIIVISISGRALVWAGLGPIPGDFELLQAGVGFAIFAFLPWCQVNRAHAKVDIVSTLFPDYVNRVIDLISELLITLVMILIAWQLWFGLQDKISYHETTFVLQFPLAWPYAACFATAVVAVVVSIYMVGVRLKDLRYRIRR